MSLLEPLQVNVDEQGYLHVTRLEQTDTFVAIQPGVYRNVNPQSGSDPYGAFTTIVFREGPDARMFLLSDGPMSYTKAPPYATSGFTLAVVIASVLLFASTMIWWLIRIAAARAKGRRESAPRVIVLARITAALFGLLMIEFLIGLLIVSGDMEPAYGIPKSFFGIEPAWASRLDIVPPLLMVLAAVMVPLTVVVWRSRRLLSGMHYTLLTAAAAAFVTILHVWHFF